MQGYLVPVPSLPTWHQVHERDLRKGNRERCPSCFTLAQKRSSGGGRRSTGQAAAPPRLAHGAAPAGEPTAALGLQSHASLAGKIVERFRPPELYPSRPAALWHLCLESPDSRSGLSFLRLRHAHVNAIGAQEWISCFRKPAAAHARDGVAPDLPFGRAEIPRRLGSRDFADVDDIKSPQFAPPSALPHGSFPLSAQG